MTCTVIKNFIVNQLKSIPTSQSLTISFKLTRSLPNCNWFDSFKKYYITRKLTSKTWWSDTRMNASDLVCWMADRNENFYFTFKLLEWQQQTHKFEHDSFYKTQHNNTEYQIPIQHCNPLKYLKNLIYLSTQYLPFIF